MLKLLHRETFFPFFQIRRSNSICLSQCQLEIWLEKVVIFDFFGYLLLFCNFQADILALSIYLTQISVVDSI